MTNTAKKIMQNDTDQDKRTEDLATKADLEVAVTRTQGAITNLRVELKEDISDLRVELKEDISDLKVVMTEKYADLQVAMTNQASDLRAEIHVGFMWLAGGLVAIAGIMVGLDVFSK